MGRQILPLTVDRLPLLIEPCGACPFWERTPAQGLHCAADPLGDKRDWVRDVLQEWGSPGRIALVDRIPAGYVTFAPARLVPRAMAFPTAPVSEDAIALITGRIAARYARQGLGRMLVQRAAQDALRHGFRALEVFATTAPPRPGRVPLHRLAEATRRPSQGAEGLADSADVRNGACSSDDGASAPVDVEVSVPAGKKPAAGRRDGVGARTPASEDPGASRPARAEVLRRAQGHRNPSAWERDHCLLPVEFLTAVGFHPVREHPFYPRMRLELRTAIRWREELGLAVERLFPPVRSPGVPWAPSTDHRPGP